MIRYKQLASNVMQDITDDRLVLGARMPSVRQFAKQHTVSMTTALNCYNKLHELGWLSVKPQSGYFVARPLTLSNAPTFPKFSVSVTVPNGYVNSYTHSDAQVEEPNSEKPFYTAQLAAGMIPRELLNRCFHRGNLRSINDNFQYPAASGELNLRSALSEHVTQNYFTLYAQELIITNGCIDAVRSAIDIVSEAGDTIAISSPCFSGLLNLLLSMKRKVLEIPCHNAQLDLTQLESYMRTGALKAGLFSANFINPHGLCLSIEQKKSLVKLATKYQVPIIEDDVFLELGFNNFKPKPIKYWDDQGWVIWCGSISKSVAPSYRLGWCAPGRFYTAYINHRQVNSLAVNVPVQAAFFEFINSGQYSKHLKKTTLSLSQHAIAYHRFLTDHLPKYACVSTLQGGMVMWVQVPGLDFFSVDEKAAELRLNFKKGAEFSTLALYKDCIRLNVGWPLEYELKDGLKVSDKLQQLCELINQQLEL
ncbi:MAG: DNA-binding transcriptional MocR family regulator [Oceanospirillaceae bacterium]|jgi:DNA-binding transcriptional MocR family regulator